MNPKPIHGEAVPFHVQHGYSDQSPIPCDFKLGDRVIYTNDYGLTFIRTVRAFKKAITPDFLPNNFIYIFGDTSCWWSPVAPETLKHLPA